MIQNDDIKVRVTISDSAGVPLTISALNAVEIYLYTINQNTGAKEIKATYRNTGTGLYEITTFDDANGIVEFVINRQLTRTLPDGKLYLETKVRLSAGSEFISSVQNIGAKGVEIDTIEMTANKNTLL
jgi:hypothetical protein